MALCPNEVEETMKRIQAHKGVTGLLVCNQDGTTVRSSLDNSTTLLYASNLGPLTHKANSVVRDLDPQNELCFLRISTKKFEILIAPEKDYILMVLQNPSE